MKWSGGMTGLDDTGSADPGPWDDANLPTGWKTSAQVFLRGRFRTGAWMGGHAYPGKPGIGNTVWPKDLTDAQIGEAVAMARNDPDWRWVRVSGDILQIRDVGGISVFVAFSPARGDGGKELPIHAYPQSGAGVTALDEAGNRSKREHHPPIRPEYDWVRDDRPEPDRD